jgi:hypothetical protein
MKPAHGLEGLDPHHCVAARCERFADRGIPFNVTKKIVEGGLGMALLPAAAYNRYVTSLGQETARNGYPSRSQLTVPVYKLY